MKITSYYYYDENTQTKLFRERKIRGKKSLKAVFHPFQVSARVNFHFYWLFVLSKLNTADMMMLPLTSVSFTFLNKHKPPLRCQIYHSDATIINVSKQTISSALFAFLLTKRTPLQRMTSFLLNIIHVYSVERIYIIFLSNILNGEQFSSNFHLLRVFCLYGEFNFFVDSGCGSGKEKC